MIADLSYVLAAQIAPMLVFSLVGGAAADRFPPQRVIVAANLAIAAGEGTFGLLTLTTRPPLWSMLCLEALTGTGMAMFYPASQALLPRLVPDDLLQEASSISRLVMNGGQMTGAALGGLLVAAAGPGWAMTLCGLGMTGTVPLLLALRPGVTVDAGTGTRTGASADASPSMVRELRDGWAEFRSHTWLWLIVIQFCLVMMAWYAGFQVLGPVVARQHLGGPAAWGAITAADALGMLAGGVVSLRFAPRKPMRFVVITGGVFALAPLSLALVFPLPALAAVSFGIGILGEVMMVQWTVAMARAIPPDKLARVSSYDAARLDDGDAAGGAGRRTAGRGGGRAGDGVRRGGAYRHRVGLVPAPPRHPLDPRRSASAGTVRGGVPRARGDDHAGRLRARGHARAAATSGSRAAAGPRTLIFLLNDTGFSRQQPFFGPGARDACGGSFRRMPDQQHGRVVVQLAPDVAGDVLAEP
ncbi:MAG: MFS transporter, partial [Trebonia sp.]